MRSAVIFFVWLASLACAMDFPGEFVQNPEGNLAFSGLPGYKSTPARYLEEGTAAGFGVAYARIPGADFQVAGAAVEIGLWKSRVGVFGSYTEMDTLYRQVYSETDLSLTRSWLIAGVGYGVSVDWLPGEESWTLNRYKVGFAVLKRPLTFSGMASLVNQGSFFQMDYGVSLRFDGEIFGTFVEYDGYSVDVGNYLNFSHMSVISAYRFPEFAISVSLVISVGGWSRSGAYGDAYPIWDWFGFTVSKTIRKKTIL